MNFHRIFLVALVPLAACFVSSCAKSKTNDVDAINANIQQFMTAFNAKDINGIMAYYVPDESVVVFDCVPPRQYVGATALRKDWESTLAMYPGTIHAESSDWKVETDGNLGYGHGFVRVTGPDKNGKPTDMTVRVTDVYKKIDGKWLAVHEHVSWPVDPATNKADLTAAP